MTLTKTIPEDAYCILSHSEIDMLNRMNVILDSKPELNGRTTTLKIPDAAYTILSKSEIAVINRLVSLLADSVTNALEMSVEKLAEQMSYGVVTVTRAVKKLCEKNIITRTKTRQKGLFGSCIWELHLDALEKPTPTAPMTSMSNLLKTVGNHSQECVNNERNNKKCRTVETAIQKGSCNLSKIDEQVDILLSDLSFNQMNADEIKNFVVENVDAHPNIQRNVEELLHDIIEMNRSIHTYGYLVTTASGFTKNRYTAAEVRHALGLLDMDTFKRVALRLNVKRTGKALNYVVAAIMKNAKSIDAKKENSVPMELKAALPQNDLSDKQIKHIMDCIRMKNPLDTDTDLIDKLAHIINHCRDNSMKPITNLYSYVMKTIEHPENVLTYTKKQYSQGKSSKKQFTQGTKRIEEEKAFSDGKYMSPDDFSDFEDAY